MRNISHWTPRYILHRLSVEQFRKKYSEDLRNFAVGAIQFLGGYLSNNDTVFEYGAGYSTIWFAERVRSIISVESDERWFSLVKERLATYENAEVSLIGSATGAQPPVYRLKWNRADKRYVVHLPKGTGVLEHVDWNYVNKIKQYERDSFDLVVNDGYARPLVANVAIDYLKRGGIFVWDDFGGWFPVEKSKCPVVLKPGDVLLNEVKEFLEKVASWRRVIFDDGVHTTALFFKPL
jgi:hypothetical protein